MPLIVFRIGLVITIIVTMYLATTQQEFQIIDDINDKVKHILAFSVLAFLADFSTPGFRFNMRKALVVLGYGLLIEVIQYFLPYRDASVFDLAADSIGIAVYAFSKPMISRLTFLQGR